MNIKMHFQKGELLTILIASLIVLFINSAIVMVIWNGIIVTKFPTSNIKEIGLFDALGLIIFVSLLLSPLSIGLIR